MRLGMKAHGCRSGGTKWDCSVQAVVIDFVADGRGGGCVVIGVGASRGGNVVARIRSSSLSLV